MNNKPSTMRIIINNGFCILIILIDSMFVFTLAGMNGYIKMNPMYEGTFSSGFLFGILSMIGIIMLSDNTIIEYKPQNIKRKWRVYYL
jgi:hypothetical protein